MRHALNEISIKDKKCSSQIGKITTRTPHEALSNINLINSYLFKLANYPADKKINKSEILRETLADFYPELTQDEIADIEKPVNRKINRLLKKDESFLRWKHLNLYS